MITFLKYSGCIKEYCIFNFFGIKKEYFNKINVYYIHFFNLFSVRIK